MVFPSLLFLPITVTYIVIIGLSLAESSQQPPEDLVQNSAEILPESPQLQMASMIDSAQFGASQCAATYRQVCYNDRFIKDNVMFLLNLTEGKRISQAAVEEVIGGCRKICEHSIAQVREKMEVALECKSDLHTETILSVFIDFPDPFADIHTPHLRETFYKENFGYVVMHDLLFQLLVYVFCFL